MGTRGRGPENVILECGLDLPSNLSRGCDRIFQANQGKMLARKRVHQQKVCHLGIEETSQLI